MAAGAIAGLVVREVLLLTAVSVACAVPASLLLGRVLRSQLFQVSASDRATYLTGITGITLVALLAGAIPAYRAATVDPMQALRSE